MEVRDPTCHVVMLMTITTRQFARQGASHKLTKRVTLLLVVQTVCCCRPCTKPRSHRRRNVTQDSARRQATPYPVWTQHGMMGVHGQGDGRPHPPIYETPEQAMYWSLSTIGTTGIRLFRATIANRAADAPSDPPPYSFSVGETPIDVPNFPSVFALLYRSYFWNEDAIP